jgi:hypothetical protein
VRHQINDLATADFGSTQTARKSALGKPLEIERRAGHRMVEPTTPNPSSISALDEVFGTSDWEKRFYEHQPAPTDLFDFAPLRTPSRNADPDKVERFAAERLRSIFSFVSQPIPILTRRKLRQFSLFLLSGNSNERAISLIKKGVSAQIKKYGGR